MRMANAKMVAVCGASLYTKVGFELAESVTQNPPSWSDCEMDALEPAAEDSAHANGLPLHRSGTSHNGKRVRRESCSNVATQVSLRE